MTRYKMYRITLFPHSCFNHMPQLMKSHMKEVSKLEGSLTVFGCFCCGLKRVETGSSIAGLK